MSIRTHLQTLFQRRYKKELTASLWNVVLSYAADSEKSGPNSSREYFDLLSREILLSEREQKRHVIETLVSSARRARRSDLGSIVESCISNRSIRDLLIEAINLSGFRGRITLDRSQTVRPSLELTDGYTFRCHPTIEISGCFFDPHIIVIDGTVESVSEIHHLLEESNKTLDEVIIFARNFSDDVSNTLKVNRNRGTLKVTSIRVPFDIEGINTLNDISVVSGTDIVSSLKGDLISSIRLSDVPTVRSVTVSRDSVTINENRTRQSVSTHVRALLDKRSMSIDDITQLIDKRIRSLMSKCVIIRIPSSIDETIVRTGLDRVLRSTISAMDHGVVEIDGTVVPLMTKISAHVCSDRCMRLFDSLGAVVT